MGHTDQSERSYYLKEKIWARSTSRRGKLKSQLYLSLDKKRFENGVFLKRWHHRNHLISPPVFLKHESKIIGDCCVFIFLRHCMDVDLNLPCCWFLFRRWNMYGLCTIMCPKSPHFLTSRKATWSKSYIKMVWRKAGCLASLTTTAGIFLLILSHTFKRYCTVPVLTQWSWFFFWSILWEELRVCRFGNDRNASSYTTPNRFQLLILLSRQLASRLETKNVAYLLATCPHFMPNRSRKTALIMIRTLWFKWRVASQIHSYLLWRKVSPYIVNFDLVTVLK